MQNVRKVFLMNLPTREEAENVALELAVKSTKEGYGRTHRVGVSRAAGVGGYNVWLYIHKEMNQYAE